MDWVHSPGGTLHLPSPTHAHTSYHVDAIQKLRRSLSRSPSKSSRFQLQPSKSPGGTPSSPLSPLGLSRTASPIFGRDHHSNPAPPSPLGSHVQVPTKGKKFTLRRVAPFRSSPRINNNPRSPVRRALSDSSNQGNVTPNTSRRSSGDENTPASGNQGLKQDPSALRLDINDGPIEFKFSRSKQENIAPGENNFPAKSSPLKRIDGRIHLDQHKFGSPAKRRSVHGATLGSDADVFTQDGMPSTRKSEMMGGCENDREMSNSFFGASNPKRTSSLRKSTLQHRHGPRTRLSAESQTDLSSTSSPAQKAYNRMSLDPSLLVGQSMQSPFVRSTSQAAPQPTLTQRQAPIRQPSQQPHPLSNAVTASNSGSNLTEDMCAETPCKTSLPPIAPKAVARFHPNFAKSLPIGASRPLYDCDSQESSQGSFGTPFSFKDARPNPAAFMSTGLISKKNRNVEAPNDFALYAMPGTPSKRNSFPPLASTPLNTNAVKKPARPSLEFGTTNTPFGSPALFGKSNIFVVPFAKHSLVRSNSFVSIDGDDHSQSPTGNPDSQSSADELPPTPTKPAGKNGKESSLRSSLFGRRTSLGPDTFMPPSTGDVAIANDARTTPPIDVPHASGRVSPHTPLESFTPPDPSGLSISAGKRESFGFPGFNSSTNSNPAFPPATPTATRDYMLPFGKSTNVPVTAVTSNDVDVSITARFGQITLMGTGEFSQVFRVGDPVDPAQRKTTPNGTSLTRFYAVKKSKRPFTGLKDKETRMKEVQVLRALRCNDHIIEYVDSWEDKGHLYIQTEYCENGNLSDFLKRVGDKARLDDFRIWKVILELSLGLKHIHDSGFIHLDLKPSNVFIDYEGVLKIGDFGLASSWPAPRNIDGEGDRYYIAPEVLHGTYDKPGDIFALGLIIAEIAANVELPDGGKSWQKLRHGDLGEFPSLTFSSDSSLPRNESGDPISPQTTRSSIFDDPDDFDPDSFSRRLSPPKKVPELCIPPAFMVDPEDEQALDHVVAWMIAKSTSARPTIDQVYHLEGVQWVQGRRRAGATVYEGVYGPADEVVNHHEQDVDMTDV